MKKWLYILLFMISVLSQAQNNSWINYSQNYFKFPVFKDGIHRISYLDLVNAGVNVTQIDPRNIQVFSRGKEEYIYVNGENDGKLNAGDFIDFYGEHNDGALDSGLFSQPEHIGNPLYSMFTDTIYYFLTWTTSTRGKRFEIETDVSTSGYTPSPYYMKKVNSSNYSTYGEGVLTPFNWSAPEYSSGQGWGIGTFGHGNTYSIDIPTPNAYSSGAASELSIGIAGAKIGDHKVDVTIQGFDLTKLSYSRYEMNHVNTPFSSILLKDETVLKLTSNTSTANTKEKNTVMYYSLKYPATYKLDNAEQQLMFVPGGNFGKDYLRITDFNNNNSTVWLYDLTLHKKIVVQSKAGVFEALVPSLKEERKCFLTSEAKVISVEGIVPVAGQSSLFTDYEEKAKGNDATYYIVAANHLQASSREYKDYRDSKGYPSLLMNIEQLYDQYSHGVRKHPMAIRNVMTEALFSWSTTPKYLLLIGKSVSANSSRNSFFELNAVPTWSVLGSDVGFTNGHYGHTILEPAVSTGRIAALNDDHVRGYLNKIKEYESAEPALWMKNVLHFGGGANSGEQQSFKNYLKGYEDIIEAPSFGAKVHTFLKSSSDPLQINLSDSVTNLVNNGVSLMCFFGHAYGSNFDQSIDEPENYENQGKYGFILANSCLIGNIHRSDTQSGSERFVLAENKGTIGFLGSSSLGSPFYLNQYSKNFYENLSKDHYGESIGDIIKHTIKDIQDSTNVLYRDVCMHMTLHGDPAIILNSHKKPDYSLYGEKGATQAQVYFNPFEVTNERDSFDLSIVVTNLGKAQNDTFNLSITRTFPNNTDTTYDLLLHNVYYRDTVTITLPVDIGSSVGINKFDISIDPLGVLDEITTVNNVASVNMLIKSSEIIPVYPFEFAVVPNKYTVMKASTGDAYAPLTSYVFQIDTSEAFSSPQMYQENITSIGGVVKWDPSVSSGLTSFFNQFTANTTIDQPNVYFWRVRPVLSSGKEIWKSSSYQYVKGKEGWGQAHFQQFKKNNFQFLDYNYAGRDYDFIKQTKKLIVTCHVSPQLPYRWDTKYKIDGAIRAQNSFLWNHFLFVAVIDKLTLEPWETQAHGNYGHWNYSGNVAESWNRRLFYFPTNSIAQIDSVVSFIKDVPDSNYVFFYNFRRHHLPSWYNQSSGPGLELKNLMKSMGADVDSMSNYSSSSPYIFFTQKGDSSKTKESFSAGEELIKLDADLKNNWLSGTVSSTQVGPAQAWHSFHWKVGEGEVGNPLDTNRITLYGIDSEGKRTVFIDTMARTGDVLDLSMIDASTYSTLGIDLYVRDDSLRTPNKLNRWQVLYDELPEAALNPSKLSRIEIKDTVQQGEDFVFDVAIENIGKYDMDSMQVVYWVLDNDLNIQSKKIKHLGKLPVDKVLFDTLKFSTINLGQVNGLWYEINPYEGEKEWQAEQHHFNNINLINFHVGKDEINPILDVTFDGIHILDGDIVSPKPYIVITLDDENQYLSLNDPSLIQVFIEYPGADGDSLELLDESQYVFIEAQLPKNKAKIELQGDFKKDGIYKLKVMSRDRSNNISGKGDGVFDYTISFEVIHESSISQVMNWPNPFSTSTQFVFTLTGSVIPEDFLIQIMTISGKIVREIDKDEFGPINIGRNVSEFKWDGRDQYGDQLANGVYLYKVQLQTQNHTFKKRTINISDQNGSTNISDKFFKKGFGKMYLLR